MRIMELINKCADDLESKKKLSVTRLMYEVMNTTTDEEMYEADTNLVDIAEKIELVLEQRGF